MTSAEIEAFLVICDGMSISKAAEKLFISQSSLSIKIKTLEKEIGCTLFQRGRGQRKLMLTEAGKKFYSLALKYENIMKDIMSLKDDNTVEKLRVSSINSIGAYLFPEVYDLFMEYFPEIILEVQDLATEAAFAALADDEIDIAFSTGRRESSRIMSQPVFAERMVFVCAREGKYGEYVDMSNVDIKDEIFIPWTDTFTDWHNASFGSPEKARIKIQIMGQLKYFLSKGDSWAVVPISVAKGLVHSGDIIQKDITFDIPKRTVRCAFLKSRPKEETIGKFMKCLKEEIQRYSSDEIDIFI